MDQNAQAFKKSRRTRMTMEAVAKYKDRGGSYFLGRLIIVVAYPIPAFLTPQDTDFGKSLLQFDAAWITNEWLSGLSSKLQLPLVLIRLQSKRLEWVDANEARIKRVATDPIGNIGDWEGVEEPWLFLAACENTICVVLHVNDTYSAYP